LSDLNMATGKGVDPDWVQEAVQRAR